MPTEAFLDTNVLVYAAYPAPGEALKQAMALDLMHHERFAVSSQVLLEFLNTTTRKRKPGLPLDEARKWLEDFCAVEVISVDHAIVGEGVDLALRYKIVFWDGAIIAAARRRENSLHRRPQRRTALRLGDRRKSIQTQTELTGAPCPSSSIRTRASSPRA